MKYTGSEIRKRTFKTKLHGYDIAEVTTFLNYIAAEWETLVGQNTQMKEKIVEAETKVKDYVAMEKAIQQTFMQAQETSGKAIENARKEEQLIVHEAELKAAQLLEKARTDLLALKENISILHAKKDSLITRLRMLLTSEMDTLKMLDTDEGVDVGKDQIGGEIAGGKSEIEDIVKSIQ
jgi:cell division initiation protein